MTIKTEKGERNETTRPVFKHYLQRDSGYNRLSGAIEIITLTKNQHFEK